MRQSESTELEFPEVLRLVAAHAKTRVGRCRVEELDGLAPPQATDRAHELAAAVDRLIEVDGPLALAGVDDAEAYLEPNATIPLEPAELLHLLVLARRIGAVRRRLAALAAEIDVLATVLHELPDTGSLVSWAAPRLGRDGRVPDDATPELARARRQATRLRQQLVSQLEEIRRAHPGACTDAPPTVRRDRYCIGVRTTERAAVRGLVLDSSGTGATVFVEPFAAVDLNNDLAVALATEAEEVRRVVSEVAAAFAEITPELRRACELVGELDAAQAKILFGRRSEGRQVMPREGAVLRLRGARHPLLDERLADLRREILGHESRAPRRVVPLDLTLERERPVLVISGPNAGGKTVALKTVGLMVLMASHAIPLPAEEGTSLPRFRRLWCHVGDEQDVAADLSTFSGAMAATAGLLEAADADTLVLYDELGTGTDPLEGTALGCALLERLAEIGSPTCASTHLAVVALTAASHDRMSTAAMEYDEGRHEATYRIRLGRPGRSRGLEIARRMGVAETVVDRATELLGGQHLELDRWLTRLEELEGELLDERSALERERLEAERLRTQLERERDELEAERRQIPQQLVAERDRLRRQAKRRLDDALAELDRAAAEREALGKRRREKLRQEALRLETPGDDGGGGTSPSVGDRVRVAGLGIEGELAERRGGRALVVARGKRTWVGEDDLVGVQQRPSGPPTASVEVEVEGVRDQELNLLGLDSERARVELERFLDSAWSGGTRAVRVVHGHGTGTLRRMVQEVCRQHPAVRSFQHPPRSRGGTGATEVELDV